MIFLRYFKTVLIDIDTSLMIMWSWDRTQVNAFLALDCMIITG